VTCPSCRTTFCHDPERDEKWDITPQKTNEFLTPARMAMLAIAVLFAIVVVFAVTKKSKTIVPTSLLRRMNRRHFRGMSH